MPKELKFDDTLVCHKCDFMDADKSRTTLKMPTNLWRAWDIATRVNQHLEILALFRVDAEGNITELHIPKQEVESCSCTLLEQDGHWDGMIHSHLSMTAVFSAMDDKTVLPNYRYSIVTNHKGDSAAVERINLPCGGMGFRPLKVELEGVPDDMGITELVKQQCETPDGQVYPFGTAMTESNGDGHATNPNHRLHTGPSTPQKPMTKAERRALRKAEKQHERAKAGQLFANNRTYDDLVPKVVTCDGEHCNKTIWTETDDYGFGPMDELLCPTCWEQRNGSSFYADLHNLG